jgi:hypothetical protein
MSMTSEAKRARRKARKFAAKHRGLTTEMAAAILPALKQFESGLAEYYAHIAGGYPVATDAAGYLGMRLSNFDFRKNFADDRTDRTA